MGIVPKVLHSIPARPTGRALVSGPRASGKVLVVSTYSMSGPNRVVLIYTKAHADLRSAEATTFPLTPTRSTAGPPFWIVGTSPLHRLFIASMQRTYWNHNLADRKSRYDNNYALHQIEEGHYSILSRAPSTNAMSKGPSKTGTTLPRVITLGGDHTITLPLLRSVNRAYGPISVIHFDSHL